MTTSTDRDWLARVGPDEVLVGPARIERLDRVVVCGAGPSGLTAALVLAERGVPVTVLEKLPTLSGESRASTFHPATLELLAELDPGGGTSLAAEVIAAGLRAPRTQFRDRRSGPVATFDLGVLDDQTEFPFRVQLEQSKFTPMVLDRLRRGAADGRLDVEVRFAHRAHRADQDADEVRLSVGTAEGLVELRAPWVVAADGAHSGVRTSSRIQLEGEEYPERFLVVSIGDELLDHLGDLELVKYVADPEEWLVLLRTPDHWRVLFPVPDGAGSDAEVLDPAAVTARLDTVVDIDGDWDVLEASLYVVSRRVATTMRDRRVLLVGDAAHQNSPLGGMGMNSGVQDAVSAGRRLASVVRDGAPPATLEEYDRLRRAVAVGHVQADSHANWLALREPDPVRRAELQAELAATAADPQRHGERMRRSAMLDSVREGL